ncbi:FISUMP domain-containing protein [Fulvivirga sp.]|uniref:FISUMP domain-containing protein n=1 Tax=Fulvivirga sp. TaxID=1931237 RepID=UPI0032EACBB1
MKLKLLISILFLGFLMQLASCSDDSEDSTPLVTLTTSSITNITSNSASAGGVVTSVSESVTEFGIVYSESPAPTTSNRSVRATSTATGPFNVEITGLTSNTTYFVRGYATNSAGTAYGNEVSFTTLAELPTLTTTDISAITNSTATGGGVITSNGNADITARGVVWGLTSEPTIDLATKTSDGTGSGTYTSLIVELDAGTEYFVRAYATNSAGTAYGNEVSFMTSSDLPILSTAEVTNITDNTANGGGEVTSEGISEVTARGIVWGVATAPTIELDTKTSDGTGLGAYESSITDLEPETEYFVRAYATNSAGTAYGNEVSFVTAAPTVEPATLTTSVISDITTTTAISGGDIISDGNASVTARGIVWGTTTAPTIELSTKTENGTGTGVFSATITGLSASTTYFVRAYATNSAGTAYGDELTFQTLEEAVVPTITTGAITAITFESAAGGGEVTSDGNATVTARGIVWGTTTAPTIELTSKTENGTGTGVFSSALTQLNENTTYFVRAYATNSAGTAYGNELTFQTLEAPVLPTVTTKVITNVNSTTASGGGQVTSDGNATTTRGIVWSQSSNPTINSSGKTTDGTGTGSFTSSLTGLSPETQYFVRAYATNSAGTAYGDQVSFTTYPALGTNEVYNPTTGRIWMDRNLGASRVATSSTDAASYGSLYQWGRRTDGHESRTSGTRTTQATSDIPGHSDFIAFIFFPGDWRNPQNDNMWTVIVGGTNNVCPSGFRVPTKEEWIEERASWSSEDAEGAFGSPLKLPLAGNRGLDGTLQQVGTNGIYWSISDGNNSSDNPMYYLNIFDTGAADGSDPRGHGKSVRCIKQLN